MKLVVRKPGQPERTVEGAEARHEFREALRSIGQSIMLPEWPYTGKIWIRAKQRLQRGEALWTHPGRHGEATGRSTILRVPVTIVGVIDATGTFKAVGESGATDPRVGQAPRPTGDTSQ